ncbi:MAG TPA: hypothetical protein VH274_06270 [Mycobacteriales bacterium]|nr:hypothetical protein [Mycobacteriales bacterium]
MRRVLQLAVLTVLTGPGVVLLGPVTAAQAAGSQSTQPGVLQTAWFWQTAAEQVNPPVAPPAPPPTEPSGVPKGDVAVANTATDGSSSKMTTVAFQVGTLKAGATVDSFTLALTLDTGGGATNVNSSAAPVVACLPTRLWPAKEGGSANDEPPTDCSAKAVPKIDGDTYTFAISDIAQQWVGDVNVGVALVNDPANTSTPFQTVFSVKSIKATMTYTPPVAAPPPPPPSSPGLGGSGIGNGAGTTSGGSSTGTSAAPPAPVNLPPTGPTTATTPTTGQSPQVAPTTPSTQPAAAVGKSTSSMPNGAFWLAGIAIALLVVVAAAVLADDAVPVPTATTTRLGRVLRERERLRQSTETDDSVSADASPTLTPRRV